MTTETLQGGRIASIVVFVVCGLLATKYLLFFFVSAIPLAFYLGFSIAYARRRGLYAKRYEWAQQTFTEKPNEQREN